MTGSSQRRPGRTLRRRDGENGWPRGRFAKSTHAEGTGKRKSPHEKASKAEAAALAAPASSKNVRAKSAKSQPTDSTPAAKPLPTEGCSSEGGAQKPRAKRRLGRRLSISQALIRRIKLLHPDPCKREPFSGRGKEQGKVQGNLDLRMKNPARAFAGTDVSGILARSLTKR
jgi:hypothetical protein